MKSFVLLAAFLAPLFFLHPASVKAEAPIKIGIIDS
jgi:hypothetical protein